MKYTTVDEIIEMLQKVSNNGKGDYEVTCNNEYSLAKKDEIPEIDDSSKTVNLGGYC